MDCSRQVPLWRWSDSAVSEKPTCSWTGRFGLFFFVGTRGTSISVCAPGVDSNGFPRLPMKYATPPLSCPKSPISQGSTCRPQLTTKERLRSRPSFWTLWGNCGSLGTWSAGFLQSARYAGLQKGSPDETNSTGTSVMNVRSHLAQLSIPASSPFS